MSIFTIAFFTKIFWNIATMFALTGIVLSSNRVGLISRLMRPLDRIQSFKGILAFWFLLGTILSAFTLDSTLAIILVPLAVLYAEKRQISPVDLVLTVTWGNMVGSEWTYFGGGDTIISWTILEKTLQRPLDMITWGKLFWLPTFLACIATLLWVLRSAGKDRVIPLVVEGNISKIQVRTIFVSILSILGITSIFVSNMQIYTITIGLITCLVARLTKEDIKKIPFKGIYIWTICIVLGTVISNFIQANYKFAVPTGVYTIGGILLVLLIVGCLTNIMTNSGLTSILLPIVMASTFVDKMWLYVLVTKAISMSYLTIFANSGLAVATSYKGLSQKCLLNKGLPIVLIQYVLFAVYFYLMRGHITLT